MDARRWVGLGLVALCTACSGAKQAMRAPSEPGVGGSGLVVQAASQAPAEPASRRYVDEQLGFELTEPGGDWLLDETGENSPEGLSIPIVLRHRTIDAQIVLQVAPAVVSTIQFAERMTQGLRSQPGFVTEDPEPLPLSDSAVGFLFTVGDSVRGRVVVREGSAGHVFMMLATWPAGAPEDVPASVNALFESVHPLPIQSGAQT